MKKPFNVEIYADGKRYSILTDEDIKAACPQGNDCFIERDWRTACEFLSEYTDEDGICVLDLDEVLDGNTVDYPKTLAIFMIFSTLMKNGGMQKLPPMTSMAALPYVNARMSMAAGNMAKYKMLDEFVIKANREIMSAKDSTVSADDIFEKIFSIIPSVKSFESVDDPEKEDYLPFFRMLGEKAKACADPSYAEKIALYTEALTVQ